MKAPAILCPVEDIFPPVPALHSVSKSDRDGLVDMLTNWNVLNDYFLCAKPDAVTLKKLILLEVMGANRPVILSRLASRLCSRIRADLHASLGLKAPTTKGKK